MSDHPARSTVGTTCAGPSPSDRLQPGQRIGDQHLDLADTTSAIGDAMAAWTLCEYR